ncbi:uncharacterized protein LOC123967582 isoform X1 [Micropterus dolomieu]|uniref:uncharacterized protein LOC123967582 isoform X1 n=1 Tax=Micropterus dolomieu TaxID=147949 RepID=UPI001E8D0E78|nr:uncharacterized protein LOC123967582 isoform X1 [Micropterus dolomieu]
MTHPTDYFSSPRSESGQGLHTQESGDAGLSSNMEHTFTENYSESAFPVADKGSLVTPIPKGELDVVECPVSVGKIWSQPSLYGHAAAPYADSHVVSADEGYIKTSTLTVVQTNYFPPQATLPEKSLEEERGQPDVEVIEEDRCITETTMNTGGNLAKPKGPPLVPGEGRKSSPRRKSAAIKNRKFYLLCWMVCIPVPASEGFPVSAIDAQCAADQTFKCYTCMDKVRCPNLLAIYNTEDTSVYHRDLNDTFPACSEISPPPPMSCAVCRNLSKILIICSDDVGALEVEDSDGGQNLNISSVGCASMKGLVAQQQTHGRGHVGVFISGSMYLTQALTVNLSLALMDCIIF